jgi:hypothetical protein
VVPPAPGSETFSNPGWRRVVKGPNMTVASKLKTAAKKLKASTKKVVRKAAQTLKPVGEAVGLAKPKRKKASSAKKSAASKPSTAKKSR